MKILQKICFVLLMGLFLTGCSTSYNPRPSFNNKDKKTFDDKSPKWSTFNSKDAMTGEFSAYATSPPVGPLKKMSFPYSDVLGRVTVGCDKDSEWGYFQFTKQPNIADDTTKDGYNLIRTRIRWDNVMDYVTLTQKWGSEFIHFKDSRSSVLNIATSNSLLLELKWYGEGSTHFKFSLNGSDKALVKIRSLCSNIK
jgi:hypothetical protein